MKLVKQFDENGCGMACVAMIADLSYEDACWKGFKKAKGTYTDTKDLRDALKRLKVKAGKRLIPIPLKDLKKIPGDAILNVRPMNRKGAVGTGSYGIILSRNV